MAHKNKQQVIPITPSPSQKKKTSEQFSMPKEFTIKKEEKRFSGHCFDRRMKKRAGRSRRERHLEKENLPNQHRVKRIFD